MKHSVVFALAMSALTACLSGCQQENRKTVSDLAFNMQMYQVQEISKKPLVPVAAEKRDTFDVVQYRGWFYNEPGEVSLETILKPKELLPELQPYLLTFEVYPPITKQQCLALAEKENISDPNGIAEVMSLEGYRVSRLVRVQIDEATLFMRAADRQAAAIRQQAFERDQQLQQIDWQLQGIKHDLEFQRMQNGY
jgi:hypothetical protein